MADLWKIEERRRHRQEKKAREMNVLLSKGQGYSHKKRHLGESWYDFRKRRKASNQRKREEKGVSVR